MRGFTYLLMCEDFPGTLLLFSSFVLVWPLSTSCLGDPPSLSFSFSLSDDLAALFFLTGVAAEESF